MEKLRRSHRRSMVIVLSLVLYCLSARANFVNPTNFQEKLQMLTREGLGVEDMQVNNV